MMSLCDHEYEEVRWYWEGGRLCQDLKCRKCGHVSKGWTTPDSPLMKTEANVIESTP
jgi:hypothetical protein